VETAGEELHEAQRLPSPRWPLGPLCRCERRHGDRRERRAQQIEEARERLKKTREDQWLLDRPIYVLTWWREQLRKDESGGDNYPQGGAQA
jgi:hypothetical protein